MFGYMRVLFDMTKHDIVPYNSYFEALDNLCALEHWSFGASGHSYIFTGHCCHNLIIMHIITFVLVLFLHLLRALHGLRETCELL